MTTVVTITPGASRRYWLEAASREVFAGAADEFSYNVVEDGVHARDLHATILHLLGIDHARLTFAFQELEQKLTGVEPSRVVHEIIARRFHRSAISRNFLIEGSPRNFC